MLHSYYSGILGDSGQAEHATRVVRNAIKTSAKEAEEELDRVHFSYNYTNMDEAVAKVVPFHYWMSRATRFYAEEAARNPAYLSWYADASEGLDKADEDAGLSARQKGFIKILGGGAGFALMMNPDSMLGVMRSLTKDQELSNGFENDDTWVGGVATWMKDHGIGLYPWLDSILNYSGAYGQTFEPDPLGVRHRAIAGAIHNKIREMNGLGPGNAFYADANAWLREKVSGTIGEQLPFGMGQEVKQREGGSVMAMSLDSMISSVIVTQNPDMTNGELVAVLNDPDTEEYRRAWDEVSSKGLIQQMMNLTAPMSVKFRHGGRDVRDATIKTIDREAEKQGLPSGYQVTQGDAEFRAHFKRQTGKDFTSSIYQDAKAEKEYINAAPAARPFIVQEHEYESLGTPEQKAKMDAYITAKQSGENMSLFMRNNDFNGSLAELFQLRRSYVDTHPEYGEYKNWQDVMRQMVNQIPNALSYYRERVSSANPDAAKYFASQAQRIRKDNPTASPRQIIEELDRYTISSSTWMAVTNRPDSRYGEKKAAPVGSTYEPAREYQVQHTQASYPQSQGSWSNLF